MAELNPIYNATVICPVCQRKIEVTKIRSKFIKLTEQDKDFCPHYESWNPIFYEAWICNYCGYAAHNSTFTDISFNDQKCVTEKITPKWKERLFNGERDIHQALDAFKIVLVNLQVRGASFSEHAKVCLRIAWLYRYSGEWVEEHRFMKYAYDYYRQAYTGEHLGEHKLDQYSCMYIIGELARRLDYKEEAVSWYGKIISASSKPGEKTKIPPRLLETTRDQIYQVRHAVNKKEKDA